MPLPITSNSGVIPPGAAPVDGEASAAPAGGDLQAALVDRATPEAAVDPVTAAPVEEAGAVLRGAAGGATDMNFTVADVAEAAASSDVPPAAPMTAKKAADLAEAMNQLPATDPALAQAVLQAAVTQPSPAAYVYAVSTAMRFGATVSWGRPLMNTSMSADMLKDIVNRPANTLQFATPDDGNDNALSGVASDHSEQPRRREAHRVRPPGHKPSIDATADSGAASADPPADMTRSQFINLEKLNKMFPTAGDKNKPNTDTPRR